MGQILVHPKQYLTRWDISYSIEAAESKYLLLIVQSTVPGIFQYIVCCTRTPLEKGKGKKEKGLYLLQYQAYSYLSSMEHHKYTSLVPLMSWWRISCTLNNWKPTSKSKWIISSWLMLSLIRQYIFGQAPICREMILVTEGQHILIEKCFIIGTLDSKSMWRKSGWSIWQ